MIYVFLANGFEETEALVTVDVLRRAGLETITVGIGGKVVTGSHGITVESDIEDVEVRIDSRLEGVVLPGGMPGAENLENSPVVQSVLEYAGANGCLTAAICAAPFILGHKGMLEGKTAVCFPGYEEELYGARLSDASVCRCENVITAKGAGVTLQFAAEIVAALKGREQANRILEMMQCAF
ncbi:MAG: DJ-1/PfpI family protein [Clostridiales bacterium]|nr:DJ-1/PfpI family protein [Clostridiales bacterium]